MADDSQFFALAAALLPALVFGGLLTDRLKPPEDASEDDLRVYGVLSLALFVLVAEIMAISAAITGDPSRVQRIIVSTAVIGATFLALVLSLWPWLKLLPGLRRWPNSR